MQPPNTELEGSRISKGEDVQSSSHIYIEQIVEPLVQLGQNDKEIQIVETDRPATGSPYHSLEPYEQIDSVFVDLILQEEIDRFN